MGGNAGESGKGGAKKDAFPTTLNGNQTHDWRNPINLLMFIRHAVSEVRRRRFNQYNIARPTYTINAVIHRET